MPSTITVGTAGGKGTKATAKRYPITKGLVAGTTKQEGTIKDLVPEQSSKVSKKEKVGL